MAPSTTVPMSTLRFGSFQAVSAPPRLWSDRVDSEDVFEHTLPSLDFAEALGSPVGRDGLQQVTYPTAAGALLGRFPSGLTAGGAALPCDGRSALGGGLGQEASAPSSFAMVRVAKPAASSDQLTPAGLASRPESSPTVSRVGRGGRRPLLSLLLAG